MTSRIILFELNEVPHRVVADFAARRPASAFARMLREGASSVTRAPDNGHLSPWVTWPTLHRGVDNSVHGIGHFGQDRRSADAEWPPVWSLAMQGGARVGVFASLHTWPLPNDVDRYAFFVPDPFAAGAGCRPSRLESFQALNLAMSRASARNVSGGVPMRQAWRFLRSAPALGLRARTAARLAAQLAVERVKPFRRSRRRTWQSSIAFDVFFRRWREDKPDFCTFFTNHVASAQHRYWAAAYPGDYDASDYSDAWRARFGDEIDFAMRHADEMLHRLMREARGDTLIVVAGSMGQAATSAKVVRTQLYLRDPAAFMTALGMPPDSWQRTPAMDPDVSIQVQPPHADRFASALLELRVAGEPVRHERKGDGFFSLTLGHANLEATSLTATLFGSPVDLASLGLVNERIQDEEGTTAYHVREGILFLWSPDTRLKVAAEVSTLGIAPAILERLGIERPAYMAAPAF